MREIPRNPLDFRESRDLSRIPCSDHDPRESLSEMAKDHLGLPFLRRFWKRLFCEPKITLKRQFFGFAIRAYNGQGRLYNEPWEGPSKPISGGFAEALRRAFSMG